MNISSRPARLQLRRDYTPAARLLPLRFPLRNVRPSTPRSTPRRELSVTKRLIGASALFVLASAPIAAQGLDSGSETAVRNFLGRCPGELKLSKMETGIAPPAGFTFTRVKAEGGSYSCDGTYVVARTRSGAAWVGSPWVLPADKKSPADRIREFGWQRLKQNFDVEIAETMTADGLLPIKLTQITEAGPVELTGSLDHTGRYFFLGEFRPIDSRGGRARFDAMKPVIEASPARGDAAAKVTLVEFSDFQCPACAHASPVVEKLLAEHGDAVRYVRADLPLVSAHPWAFPAAVYGRAIWRQNPDAFWAYKKQVYDNQQSLNAFVLDTFAEGFAREAGLDMEKFYADLNDPALGEAVRRSMGAAFTAQIHGTPTFFVNGQRVAFGDHGDALQQAVSEALAR